MNKDVIKRLAFLCLSDGSLSMHKGCVNASFKLAMCVENKDMAELAATVLDEIGATYTYKEGPKYFELVSRVHPVLTKLWKRIYLDGRRIPSPHDFKLLDWEAVAIMYMCDGNIQRTGKRWYPLINMCKWSYAELCWVKVQFKERLGVDINIYKCGKYFRVGVPAHHCEMFFENVRPFMLKSFAYKLPENRVIPE